jgi:hypothetical protein
MVEHVRTASPEPGDPFLDQVAALDAACLDVERTVKRLRAALKQVSSLRVEGHPASAVLAEGPGAPARRAVRDAWSRLNGALNRYRVQAVRIMVDDEGLTVAQAARVMGNARQVVSRLYHQDHPGAPGLG